MKVLIVGAGIGGLALGAHLRKNGHAVTIIEKSDTLHKSGFVLGLWGAGLNTLDAFNIDDKLATMGYFPTRFNLRSKQGHILRRFNFIGVVRKYGKAITLLRSDFHNLLLGLNESSEIKLKRSLHKIEETSDGVVAYLTNGQRETFDLIVGADGIHSKVRELTFGAGHMRYSGLTSWIVLTDTPKRIRRPNITEVWAGDKYVGVFPYKSNQLCAIFGLKAKEGCFDGVDSLQLLRTEFAEFGWMIPDILRQITPAQPIFHTDWNEVHMKQWVKGRVVLMGDAAHAMLPTAGSGASLALEDAYWLALELDANPDDLPAALGKFAARQRAAEATLRRHTDFIGRIIKLSGPTGIIRDILIRIIPTRLVSRDIQHLMAVQDKNRQPDRYSFESQWEFDAPARHMQRIFTDFANWPRWWRFVRHVSVTPDPNGSTTVQTVFGLGPYTIRLNLGQTQITSSKFEGILSGDLYGTALVRFAQNNQTSTVSIHMDVVAEKPWIRTASRFLHPVFRLSHNWAMRYGARELAKAANCRLISNQHN